MYKILICFCMLFILFIYIIYKDTVIYTNINLNNTDIIFCPKDKDNPMCQNNYDDTSDNEFQKKNKDYNNVNKTRNNNNKYNKNDKDKLDNDFKMDIVKKKISEDLGNDKKKTVEEILESLAKQQLYESSYKCEKIKTYNGIKYFEYMDTDPYVDWDDVQKLCKNINGFFFY